MFGIDLDGFTSSPEKSSADYYTDEGGMLVRPLVDASEFVLSCCIGCVLPAVSH